MSDGLGSLEKPRTLTPLRTFGGHLVITFSGAPLRHVPKFVALLVAAAVTMSGTAGLANAAPVSPAATVASPGWGTYSTVTPARVLDTREGIGAPDAPLGAGGSIDLTLLGVKGVPAAGVSAVVLNLTVTGATQPSFLTAWPAGTTRPNVSSINFVAGTNRANLVTVPVGTVGAGAGKISIWNPAGTVQVVADVMGYYLADDTTASAGFYLPELEPSRLLDTRVPEFGGPLASGESVSVPVDYNMPGFEPNAHIRALAVNITAVNPTKKGFLAAYAGGSALPTTSTLNFAAGTVTPNMAIVPVGPCVACGAETGLPSITVFNGSPGTAHVLVDLVGLYDDGQVVDPETGEPLDGLRFKPVTPTRIVDSRPGAGNLGTTTFKGAKADKTIVLTPRGVAGDETIALVTNTTAVRPTLPTFITLWADFGGLNAMPGVSNLNAVKGQIVANATITDLGIDSTFTNPAFNIYNNAGNVDVLVDVVGTMEYPFGVGPVAGLSAPAGPKPWTRKATAQQSAR
jgi:hypothetical protein